MLGREEWTPIGLIPMKMSPDKREETKFANNPELTM
jgi:hypothetical protein